MDWLDNQVFDNHQDRWWLHQEDGDWNNVEWPLSMDFSYNTLSDAYTHTNLIFQLVILMYIQTN